MQPTRFSFVLGLLCLIVLSCKKNNAIETTGYTSKIEPLSISEIPNGHQYVFGGVDFSGTPEISLQIKTARDTANCSFWNVYLVNGDGDKYLLSGLGANRSSYYHTHHFYSSVSGSISLVITRTKGPAEKYSSVLVKRHNW